jgi:quercetin dioxygenase-like cupin family protein
MWTPDGFGEEKYTVVRLAGGSLDREAESLERPGAGRRDTRARIAEAVAFQYARRVRTDDGLTVLAPGEGQSFPALDLVRKVTAAETDGRWGVVIVTGSPGLGGRTHVHVGEPEAFFLLEGRVELLGAESTTILEPGAFVLVPPDTEHGLRVLGDTPARWLAIWPSALDGLPEEIERATAEGADPDSLREVRRRHGVRPGRQR